MQPVQVLCRPFCSTKLSLSFGEKKLALVTHALDKSGLYYFNALYVGVPLKTKGEQRGVA